MRLIIPGSGFALYNELPDEILRTAAESVVESYDRRPTTRAWPEVERLRNVLEMTASEGNWLASGIFQRLEQAIKNSTRYGIDHSEECPHSCCPQGGECDGGPDYYSDCESPDERCTCGAVEHAASVDELRRAADSVFRLITGRSVL
jgi:hypothetical protein